MPLTVLSSYILQMPQRQLLTCLFKSVVDFRLVLDFVTLVLKQIQPTTFLLLERS